MYTNKLSSQNPLLYYKLATCILAFCAACFYLNFEKIYSLPPQSMHHWRQSDGFSLALNYYQFRLPFFKPEMHHILGGNGRAVGEFPILYYIVGQLFHIFGESYAVFRVVHFLPFFISIVYICYFLIRRLDFFIFSALSVCIFLLASPLIVYYSLNYLPNVPSLGFLLIGGTMLIEYLFFNKSNKRINSTLIGSSIMLAMAGLLKPPTLTSYIAFMSVVGISLVFPRFIPCIQKEKKYPVILAFIGIGIVNVAWFYYASNYQKVNQSFYFLLNTSPYWDVEPDIAAYIRYRISTEWLPVIAHKSILSILMLSMMFVSIFSIIKKQYFVFVFIVIGVVLDALCYFFWYSAFKDHDYYFINLLGLPYIVFILALYYLHDWVISHKYLSYLKTIIPVILFSIIALRIRDSKSVLKKRYSLDFIKPGFNISFYKPELKAYVQSLGLTPTTKVISIPDNSPNMTLSLLNLKGITDLYHNYRWAEDLAGINDVAKENKIKYLIVCRPEWIQREDFKRVKARQIGRFESIYFYELLD